MVAAVPSEDRTFLGWLGGSNIDGVFLVGPKGGWFISVFTGC